MIPPCYYRPSSPSKLKPTARHAPFHGRQVDLLQLDIVHEPPHTLAKVLIASLWTASLSAVVGCGWLVWSDLLLR